jgi:hypothetical protein
MMVAVAISAIFTGRLLQFVRLKRLIEQYERRVINPKRWWAKPDCLRI